METYWRAFLNKKALDDPLYLQSHSIEKILEDFFNYLDREIGFKEGD